MTTGAARKKDKQTQPPPSPVPEAMDITPSPPPSEKSPEVLSKNLEKINDMCDELLKGPEPPKVEKPEAKPEAAKIEVKAEEKEKEKERPTVKKVFNKGKTADLSGAIKKAEEPKAEKVKVERKNSLPEDLKPERRKSRILETAEKFQSMNNQNNEKYKKFVIPGVSVGSFKKEFERKASITSPTAATIGPMERKQRNSESQDEDVVKPKSADEPKEELLKESDSKSSVGSFSLEDARRSMENSIALLNQAKAGDSGKEVDQLCAKTEEIVVVGEDEREKKLKNAREIISNAIPRLGGGRKPPTPFGANGRTQSGNLATGFSRPVKLGDSPPTTTPTAVGEPPVFPTPSKGKFFNFQSFPNPHRSSSPTLPSFCKFLQVPTCVRNSRVRPCM